MKKNKRNRSPYPGIDRQVNLKNRQELLDFDYLDKLSHEEKLMA